MHILGKSNSDGSSIAYTLAVLAGSVPMSLGIALRSEGSLGPVALSTALIVLAGLIFTGLGLYSTAQDERKGFGVACMAVGAIVVGIGQTGIL